MKKFIYIIIGVLSLNVFAKTVDPTEFCNEPDMCTDRMKEITAGYKSGVADFSKQNLSAISGSCYHINSAYDPKHEHYGAFVFDRTDKGLTTTGVFSFFEPADPFGKMNATELKDWFIQNKYNFVKTIESPTQIELDYLESMSDLHYWFRSNKENTKVYMISEQVIDLDAAYVFCEMNLR